ncbi:MAG: hypothetical protein A2297_04970 [Elusimicrobia bacterium RIFOXYB2_FULL_48_7]|nr:MAG: hypothetical protein A2297_04970 [Elusimicrobia bacterium RIFOXYB2_FULL_48_7]
MTHSLNVRNHSEGATVKVNAVGYIRCSTENQIENTQGLPIQREAIFDFCKQNPKYDLLKIYEDAGLSGTTIEKRPALLNLLEDARNNKFKIVLVSKLDRIARDTFFTLFIEKELKKHGVELYSIAEPYRWDDPAQKVFLSLISAFAEYERTRIVERLYSGRIRKIKAGKFGGGKIPYGYASNKKGELVLNPQQAEIIKRIFRMRMGRMPFNRIARILNAEGISTYGNKKFFASTIKYILSNPIYKGRVKYCDIDVKGIHQRIELFNK